MCNVDLERVCSIVTETGYVMLIWRVCSIVTETGCVMLIWRGCVVLLQRLGV